MRHQRLLALLQLCAVCGFTAVAEAQAPAKARPAAPKPEPKGFWQSYTSYVDRKIEELMDLPLWGLTASLPEGVLKLRYDYNPAKAEKFFDADGNRITLLPPITFTGVPNEGDTLVIDPHVTGRGAGHTFQVAYGITDTLNGFVEFPFTKVDSDLELGGTVNGQPMNSFTRAIVIDNIESNGRPRPQEKFRGGMDLGNVMAGASWNYHRTEHFSSQIVPRVFLPTGHPADPDNDLSFLLGPEIDRGIEAWTVNLTHVFDVRPVDFLTFNLEVQGSYRFGHDRPTPKWLPISDCRRVQDAARRTTLGCSDIASPYDPLFDLQQSEVFPSLEGLDPEYRVEPGISTELTAGFTVEPGIPIPIQIAYNFRRDEALTIRATGQNDSGARFEALTRDLALFEAAELHSIGAGIQIPLFPLYVPIAVTVSRKWAIAGKNSIVLENNTSIAFEMFLPVGDLWMPPRKKRAAVEVW